MGLERDIEIMANQLRELCTQACEIYKPLVDDICSRTASEAEVEHLLDYMLSFCGFDDFLPLFKRVCRNYYYLYPQMIIDYVYLYREMYVEE